MKIKPLCPITYSKRNPRTGKVHGHCFVVPCKKKPRRYVENTYDGFCAHIGYDRDGIVSWSSPGGDVFRNDRGIIII